MNIKEMTNEDLANYLHNNWNYKDPIFAECISRLRNYIPKPTVEVVEPEYIAINGIWIYAGDTSKETQGVCEIVCKALGLESGE
jgi:hypothetical protein